MQAFANDLEEGSLEAYIKSEEIPESNDGPVQVAVAKNFDEMVMNNKKDVLIEFYAPWCKIFTLMFCVVIYNLLISGGHCKKLAPVLEELGEKLKDENIVIVKMDATANDVPPKFDVRGFPTLFWIPSGRSATPLKYEGGREVEDFVRYISKFSINELRGFDRAGKPKKSEL